MVDRVNAGLDKKWLVEVYKNNWFKLYVSKQFGGLELSLPKGLQEVRKASSLNGSLGWCVNLGAGANYFSGFFSNEGAKQIFSGKESVLAGSGGLANNVEKMEGGYFISGEWNKSTGALHANYFTGNAKLPSGEIVSFAIEKEYISLIENWGLAGMKNSSSYGYKAENAFVKNASIFRIDKPVEGSSYLIHNLPFMLFAQFSMTASIIGLAEGVVKDFTKVEMKENALKSLNDLNKACEQFGDDMAQLAEKVWSNLKKSEVLNEKEIGSLVKKVGKEIYYKVCNLYFDAGLVMADENHPVRERYNDFMVAIQHSIFK